MNFTSLLHRLGLWLMGVFLVIAAAGIFWYLSGRGQSQVQYATVFVKRGNVENTIVAAGTLQPVRYVDVGAQTSGQLKSLKVKRGDRVEKAQLLAEIDPALASSALTAAQAMLENLTAQREAKRAQLLLAGKQLDRNEYLVRRDLIAASEADIARAAYNTAFSEFESLSAQIKQAEATIETTRASLGYTRILAPMAGEVVSIATLEGQTINANQQAPIILRIADLSTMTVWAQVSEADVMRVKAGQEVYFTVLGQPERRRYGKVRQILPAPELLNNVVFYNVLFDVPNPQQELKIQMTAQIFIVVAQAKGALLIPTAAIGNASEGSRIQVRILKADGKVELRPIKIGVKNEIAAQVTEGLKEGERVVIGEIQAKDPTKSAPGLKKGP
uniref:Macrolide transporter subunit MacA n=1 Tax=Anaerolinea thermolimosa TaxID=229919 RepID=A0A7C4PMA3_9CHLR